MLDADLAGETLQGISRSSPLRDSQIGYVIIRHRTINIHALCPGGNWGPGGGWEGGWERKSLRIAIPWPDIN